MQILGIDIGGSDIKGAVVDTAEGKLVSERLRLVTPQPATPEAVGKTLVSLADGIGFDGPVGCAFPARITGGLVRTATNIDAGWIDVRIEELFSSMLGRDVFALNDADAAGLAELRFGAVCGRSDKVLFLTVGTGIGSALFIGGNMYPGTELGLMRFKGDLAERYCSDAVRRRKNLKWEEWAKRLNEYLCYLEFLLCPDCIVLGGGVSKKFDKFSDKLNCRCEVLPAALRNDAGIIGAALYGESRITGRTEQTAHVPSLRVQL